MNSFTANDPEAQDLLALARLGGDSSLASGFRPVLGRTVYTNEERAFDLGGLGLSRVLSATSRRHFPGEE